MPLIILMLLSFATTWFTLSDTRARGLPPVGWGYFVLLTSGIGLPVYLMARKPKIA